MKLVLHFTNTVSLFEGIWLTDWLSLWCLLFAFQRFMYRHWARRKSWWKQFRHFGISDKQREFLVLSRWFCELMVPVDFHSLGCDNKGITQIPLFYSDALFTSLGKVEPCGCSPSYLSNVFPFSFPYFYLLFIHSFFIFKCIQLPC